MQFKVPQDVLRPDKIVGFLTLRQLVIVILGGGICYSLYLVLEKHYLPEVWLPPVIFVALITLAFAFFRFHDIPFEKAALLFVEFKFRPRKRVWQKLKGDFVLSVLNQPLRIDGKSVQKEEAMTAEERRKRLLEATKAVEKQESKLLK